ncbi:MAG: DEAD/DEAH box helicase [Pseudomonadota bacterium]
MTFNELGLSELTLKAVSELGYETPSPIQEQGIPIVLSGQDLMAAAQTGTGKTAGFTLPMLELLSKNSPATNNQARALVLTPTRELAAQVHDSVALYSKYLPLTAAVVFGGVKINPQMKRLTRGADVLVATPGRLLDLHQQNAVRFDQLEILVLDEADRMLDMGFIHDIQRIIKLLPKTRQNLMFSATFSPDIRSLAKTIVQNPVEISVTPSNAAAPTVKQCIYTVDKSKKSALLTALIKQFQWPQVLVFSRTKHGANRLSKQLTARGINASAIHGNKSQGARTRALAAFKNNDIQALVATDIAARGIDIDQLPQVINVDLPSVAADYVHRIGRTGRAGSTGEAISLVSTDEIKELQQIERLIRQKLERKVFEGFEPSTPVPNLPLDSRPIKTKKPKKPKKPKQKGSRHGGNRPSSPEHTPRANRRRRSSSNSTSEQNASEHKARQRNQHGSSSANANAHERPSRSAFKSTSKPRRSLSLRKSAPFKPSS